MAYYIAEILFFISVAIIAYFIIRKLPRIKIEIEEIHAERKKGSVNEKIYTIDKKVLSMFIKILRRMRVGVLRLDTRISKKLDSVKKKVDYEEEQNMVKELSAETQEDLKEEK